MKPVLRKIILPENKRILAISDIHAHKRYLENLLKKINFTKDDILFIVGDIIEKGPESLETLRYVMALCRTYTVYPLMGNVDAWRVILLDDERPELDARLKDYITSMKKQYGGCLFTDMCESADIPMDDIQNVRIAIKEQFRAEIDFLRGLPTVYETQKFIFVHAGLPADGLEQIAQYDAFDLIKIDAFMDSGRRFDKYVVVGHWPVMLYSEEYPQANPIINRKQKIISIDGGCGIKDDGQLNALIIPNLHSEHFTFESYDELPVGIAETAQQKEAGTVFVKWIDSGVERIENGAEFSIVRHLSTGKIFKVPNCYLYGDRCNDYTDHKIAIRAGERVSIVKKTSEGCFIKKNGASGWYYGKITPITL